MKKVIFAILSFLTFGAAHASTVTLTDNAIGWINQSGGSNGTPSTNNFIVGNCGLNDCGIGEYRDFFQFAIPTLTGTVTGATLTLNNFNVSLQQNPSLSVLFTSTSGLNFASLGTGTAYATQGFVSGDSGHTSSIVLDAAAFNDIFGAQGGNFTISGRVISPTVFSGSARDQFAFGGSFGQAQLTITTAVPEPASLLLLGMGLVGLAAMRRRKA